MAISEAEKIRKAEEIYYRRRYNQNKRGYPERKNSKNMFVWLLGKFIYVFIIVLCIVGYNNKDYILSDSFKKDVDKFINKEININEFINDIQNRNSDNSIKQVEDSKKEKNQVEIEINKESSSKETKKIAKNKKKTTEEKIKSEIKFGAVLKRSLGVTSRYGYRKSKNKNVEGYHTGIDIAAKKGENIYSSISGTVIEISNKGNYGKHIIIQSKEG